MAEGGGGGGLGWLGFAFSLGDALRKAIKGNPSIEKKLQVIRDAKTPLKPLPSTPTPPTAPAAPAPDPITSRLEKLPRAPKASPNRKTRYMSKTEYRFSTWLDGIERQYPGLADEVIGAYEGQVMDPMGGLRAPGRSRSARAVAQNRSAPRSRQRGQVGYESTTLRKGEQGELDRLLGKQPTDFEKLMRRNYTAGRQPSTRGRPRAQPQVRRPSQQMQARAVHAARGNPPPPGASSVPGIDDLITNARLSRAGQVPIGGSQPGQVVAGAVPERNPATAANSPRSQGSRSSTPRRQSTTAHLVSPGPQFGYLPIFGDSKLGPVAQRLSKATARQPGVAGPSAPALDGGASLKPPSNNCDCSSTKKARKPRKPRSVCYRGTYIETARGTSKVRREQVPC